MDKDTILNGRYKIIRPIGYGGMAEVFLAHDQLLDRNVAVKMLRDQFLQDKELLEQFRREAKSAARLVHPYIINIYDVASEGNNQYIVMEYVDGVTLKEYMQEHKLSLNAALEIGVRLADALQHAHSHNVIHCDIKPQNILIDKNLNPKIADFGIAKMITNQTMVYSGSVMGSVHYISPEQASGGQITACSDVYSLGVVLFEMLTGTVPYTGSTAVAVAMMHVEKPVPQLKDYMDDVPDGLQAIIDKTLAKRCEDRYADAKELRRSLLNLKMRLFPFSSEDYKQELGTLKAPAPRQEARDDGATVIMKPVRAKKDLFADQHRTEQAPVQEQAAVTEGNGNGIMPKKKINYTKLLMMITAAVVCISVIAHFIFNRNLQEIPVPDVTNMTVVEAQKMLEEKEFKVELEEAYGDPDKYKAGTVMKQSPKAGEKRKQGSLIILTICRGAELKSVPEVIGMSLSKAEATLESAGFRVGKITKKHVDGERVGAVLGQAPKALDKAPKGSSIDLVVNEGDKEIPNVIGKSINDAKKILEQAGLKLGEVKKVNDSSVAKNVVLSTNPNAGTKVSAGDAVSITVAEGSGEKKSTYVDFVVPGNDITDVQVILQDAEGKRTLYSGKQPGGVRLRQRVDYVGTAHVEFICNGKVISEKEI